MKSKSRPRGERRPRSTPRHDSQPARAIPTWGIFLAALFAAALGWRLAYLSRLTQTPLAETLTVDSAIYWDWAGWIRLHGVAGGPPFFLGPLYPYALTVLRVFAGDSIPQVLALQAIWGAAAVVLLADAARRVAGATSAAIVGVMLAVYQMAVFFDGLVLAESLLFFIEALLLWTMARRDWTSAGPASYATVGVLVGLLAQGRATALLLLPVIAVTWQSWSTPARRRGLLLALSAFVVMSLPSAIHNRRASGEWIPFTYNLGYNLYVGNNPEATGGSVPITGTTLGSPFGSSPAGGGEIDGRDYLRRAEGIALSPAASSRHWTDKAVRYAMQHPGHAAQLALRKLRMFWSWREHAQIESVREFAAAAGPMGIPFIGEFALIGVLGFAGLFLAARHGPMGRFLIGYVIAISLAVVPFFVTDRYRIHLVPALALLAAITLARLLDLLRRRNRPELTRAALALAAGIVVVGFPAPALDATASPWLAAKDRGDRLLHEGRTEQALSEFDRALEAERRGPLDLGGATATRAARAQLYAARASALRRLGRHEQAVASLERAAVEAPDNPMVVRGLADAYVAAGSAPRADSTYAELDSLPRGTALTAASRGWQAARAGQLQEARRYFQAAVTEAPRFHEAWGALIRVEAQLGLLEDATRTLERAQAAGLPRPSRHAHEALLAVLRGDTALAARALRQVPLWATRADPALADIVQTVRQRIPQ